MHTYIYNIIFLFAAISLFGCGNGDRSVSKVDGIEFDSIIVDTTARLTADANSPSCRIQFVVRHRADTNRAFDGEDLRYRFGNVKKIPDAIIAASIDNRPCSVLEMMAALALRAGENVFGYPIIKEGATWLFWEMCRNLDILDDKKSLMAIKEKVKAFLERDYRDDGRGNIFCFTGINEDIRKIEIWNQAMVYINYHYDDFLKAAKIMPQ